MTPWDKAFVARRTSSQDVEPPARYTEDAALYIVAAIALIVIMFGG